MLLFLYWGSNRRDPYVYARRGDYKTMKQLGLILSAILLSAPISAILSVGADYLLTEPVTVQGYNYNPPILATMLVVAVYEIPVYIVIGIPVTYLIDYLVNKFFSGSSRLKEYSYHFIGYFIAAFLLSFNLFHCDFGSYFMNFIPVFVYFHILWALRSIGVKS